MNIRDELASAHIALHEGECIQPVTGVRGYWVTDRARVFSAKRNEIGEIQPWWNKSTVTVHLSINGKKRDRGLATLVARAFIPPSLIGPRPHWLGDTPFEAYHKNGESLESAIGACWLGRFAEWGDYTKLLWRDALAMAEDMRAIGTPLYLAYRYRDALTAPEALGALRALRALLDTWQVYDYRPDELSKAQRVLENHEYWHECPEVWRVWSHTMDQLHNELEAV